MRVILYKANDSEQFTRYIDIGEAYCNQVFLNYLEEGYNSYKDWYKKFINDSFGSQILTINYYLFQLSQLGEDDFVDIEGIDIYKRIKANFSQIDTFNKKWFWEDAPIFKGLEFNSDIIMDEIESSVENENGYYSEVVFKDGSTIKFIDEDDTIASSYVKESEYSDFVKDIESIVMLLK